MGQIKISDKLASEYGRLNAMSRESIQRIVEAYLHDLVRGASRGDKAELEDYDANVFSGAGCDVSSNRPDFDGEAEVVKCATTYGRSPWQQVKDMIDEFKEVAAKNNVVIITSLQDAPRDDDGCYVVPDGVTVDLRPDNGPMMITNNTGAKLSVGSLVVISPSAPPEQVAIISDGKNWKVVDLPSAIERKVTDSVGRVWGHIKSRDLGEGEWMSTPVLVESWKEFSLNFGDDSTSVAISCPCGETLTSDDKSPNDGVITCWKCGYRRE
jgi:hypothetical protein